MDWRIGNRKDIVWIRIAWCWRQTGGSREVMAYLVVHIYISSIKDLRIYVMHCHITTLNY